VGRGAHALVTSAMAVRHEIPRVSLRDMRRDDLPAVLEIERRSFAQPWSRAFFEKELATPFARLVVATRRASARPRRRLHRAGGA
jgi:ribosomal protein S18 acetylase RimI-like enzyme